MDATTNPTESAQVNWERNRFTLRPEAFDHDDAAMQAWRDAQAERMRDNRLTLNQAAEDFYVGHFQEGLGEERTLFPDQADGIWEELQDTVQNALESLLEPETAWQAQLAQHMDQQVGEGRGEHWDSIAQHHMVFDLPAGMNADDHHQMIEAYVREHFTDQGLMAHYVLHPAHDYDPAHPFTYGRVLDHIVLEEARDSDAVGFIAAEDGPHVHVAVPVYPMNTDGTFADLPHAGWDNPSLFRQWRDGWEDQWLRSRRDYEAQQEQEALEEGAMRDLEALQQELDDQAIRDQQEAQEELAQQAMMQDVVGIMLPKAPALDDASDWMPDAWTFDSGMTDEWALVASEDVARLQAQEAAWEAMQSAELSLGMDAE